MATEYGIQMYSVRDSAEKSLHDSLKAVAELGYKYIEFAGFFDNKAEEVKAWLDELGLVCSGTHTGLDLLTPEKINDTIRYHKTIGCDCIIVPGCDWSTLEKCTEVLSALAAAEKVLSKNGIKLCYHNHSNEFFPTEYGTVFEYEILDNTDIMLEVDTFWLFNAGINVIDYLDAHKDRIALIHLKDGIPSKQEDKRFGASHNNVRGMSLGQGEAPVSAVREWAIKNGILMVVESEGLDPTGIEEVGRCIEYLKTLD